MGRKTSTIAADTSCEIASNVQTGLALSSTTRLTDRFAQGLSCARFCRSGFCSSAFGAVASVIAANTSREDESATSAAGAIGATIAGLRVSLRRANANDRLVEVGGLGVIDRGRKILVGGKEQRGQKKADEYLMIGMGPLLLFRVCLFRRVLHRATAGGGPPSWGPSRQS